MTGLTIDGGSWTNGSGHGTVGMANQISDDINHIMKHDASKQKRHPADNGNISESQAENNSHSTGNSYRKQGKRWQNGKNENSNDRTTKKSQRQQTVNYRANKVKYTISDPDSTLLKKLGISRNRWKRIGRIECYANSISPKLLEFYAIIDTGGTELNTKGIKGYRLRDYLEKILNINSEPYIDCWHEFTNPDTTLMKVFNEKKDSRDYVESISVGYSKEKGFVDAGNPYVVNYENGGKREGRVERRDVVIINGRIENLSPQETLKRTNENIIDDPELDELIIDSPSKAADFLFEYEEGSIENIPLELYPILYKFSTKWKDVLDSLYKPNEIPDNIESLTEANKILASFPEQIPGAKIINKYYTPNASKLFIHVNKIHPTDNSSDAILEHVKEVHDDIQAILSYLIKNLNLREVYNESFTQELEVMTDRLFNRYDEAGRIQNRDARKKERDNMNELEKRASELRSEYRNTTDKKRQDEIELEYDEICNQIAEKRFAKYDSLLNDKLNKEMLINESKYDASLRLHRRGKLKVKAAESEEKIEAGIHALNAILDGEENDDNSLKILDDREDAFLEIMAEEEGYMHVCVYGAAHAWGGLHSCGAEYFFGKEFEYKTSLKDNIYAWNRKHPNNKVSLIEIIPQRLDYEKLKRLHKMHK